MKKLPNDFEKIEDFYKDNLYNQEIEPSENVWRNIESKLPTTPVSSGFFSTSNMFYVGATLVAGTILTVYLLQIYNEKKAVITKPVILDQKKSLVAPIPSESVLEVTGVSKKEKKRAVITQSQPQQIKPTSVENKTEIVLETRTEPSKEILVAQEPENPKLSQKVTEEKQLNFYEKIAKAKKDSTRPLFVPKK